MNEQTIFIFLLAIAIGAYVQTVTGFAMGLIIMGITASLQLMPISFIAAVISLTGLTNVILAVYKNHHHINWPLIRIIMIGFMPALFAGLALLYFLDKTSTQLLQLILGIVIILGGILLVLKPHPTKQRSPTYLTLLAGASSGVMGGLFSTSAPPLIYYLYKQPLTINAIKNTLLMTFMMGSMTRIGVIGTQGYISQEMLLFALYSLPVVFLFTWLGKKYPPPLSDINMRRTAFALLIILGVLTTLTALVI
ncbi:MAG: sulfite exporter TauE/SafE family protein [Cocleimonas sp.]|nr:sulfite exporter TauE/SafE family protein [Cocleimonas sp.]